MRLKMTFFKLMNTVRKIFGKFMETDRLKVGGKRKETTVLKLATSLRLQHYLIYDENLGSMTMKQLSITLNHVRCMWAFLYWV